MWDQSNVTQIIFITTDMYKSIWTQQESNYNIEKNDLIPAVKEILKKNDSAIEEREHAQRETIKE